MAMSLAPPGHRAAILDLQRHLANAEARKLCEIVALVDSLPERGAADGLIAPLRERLQKIKPGRRLNLTRLLFQPANSVILSATQWRRGALALPRQSLPCLAGMVRRGLGVEFERLGQALGGVMSNDPVAVLQAGRLIWPQAAQILAQAPMPPEWSGMTGLGMADFIATTRPLAVLLSEAVMIEDLVQSGPARDEHAERAMRACLGRALEMARSCPEGQDPALVGRCLGLLLAICLERLPDLDLPLIAAGDLASRADTPAPRAAADAAIDAALDQAQSRLDQSPSTLSLEEINRLSALLDTLDQPGPAGRPSRKPRVTAMRRTLDAQCRSRFEAEISQRLLPGLSSLGPANTAGSLALLEETARDLRRLEAVGRQMGSAAHFERALADCARTLPGLATAAKRVDLARIVEILQGPEAALEILDAAAAPTPVAP